MNRLNVLPLFSAAGLILAVLSFTPALANDHLIPLRLAIAPPSANRVAFLVAYDQGIYEKNGLKVDQYIPAGSAAQMLRDGMTINPNFVKPGGEPPPIATGLGTNLALVATDATYPTDMVFLATLDDVMRGHIVVQPEITSLEQLKGKRIGYTGGSRTHYVALVFAEKMGWDPVYDISLMSNARMDALKSRRVDAIIANENRLAEARASGFKSLLDVSEWNVPIAGTGVAVPRSWLEDNRDTVRRFIKSMIEADAMLKQNKGIALSSMQKWWGVMDKARQDLLYAGATDSPRKPYPSLAGIKKVMEVFDSNEMRKYEPEDFYDDSFVRELDDSGYIDSLYK